MRGAVESLNVSVAAAVLLYEAGRSGGGRLASFVIVDGYNVIGALDRYAPAATGGLDAVQRLPRKRRPQGRGLDGATIVVVFDAHRGPDPERTELRAGGVVRVVYSAPGESADDVIERLLANLAARPPSTPGTSPCTHALARGATRATPHEFADLFDELPAVTRSPAAPRDRASPTVSRPRPCAGSRRSAGEPPNKLSAIRLSFGSTLV